MERQIQAVRQIKAGAPRGLYVIGSGYTYLQEYLPNVAQAVVRAGWADAIGLGRAVLSYPAMLTDAIQGRTLEKKFICRTFSECTTAPRNGLRSGCYPLDKYYTQKPEFQKLKEIKKNHHETPIQQSNIRNWKDTPRDTPAPGWMLDVGRMDVLHAALPYRHLTVFFVALLLHFTAVPSGPKPPTTL